MSQNILELASSLDFTMHTTEFQDNTSNWTFKYN